MPPRPTVTPPAPRPNHSSGITAGDLATALWRTLAAHDHVVSTAASRAAADTALRLLAQRVAQADLDRFAPPPRPPLMVDLHEQVRSAEWTQPGLLAAALRRHADRLDAIAHRHMLDQADAA